MANTGSISPPCHDTRECFAANYIHGGYRVCRILNGTYYDNTCPFCKKRKENVACSPRETSGQLLP